MSWNIINVWHTLVYLCVLNYLTEVSLKTQTKTAISQKLWEIFYFFFGNLGFTPCFKKCSYFYSYVTTFFESWVLYISWYLYINNYQSQNSTNTRVNLNRRIMRSFTRIYSHTMYVAINHLASLALQVNNYNWHYMIIERDIGSRRVWVGKSA